MLKILTPLLIISCTYLYHNSNIMLKWYCWPSIFIKIIWNHAQTIRRNISANDKIVFVSSLWSAVWRRASNLNAQAKRRIESSTIAENKNKVNFQLLTKFSYQNSKRNFYKLADFLTDVFHRILTFQIIPNLALNPTINSKQKKRFRFQSKEKNWIHFVEAEIVAGRQLSSMWSNIFLHLLNEERSHRNPVQIDTKIDFFKHFSEFSIFFQISIDDRLCHSEVVLKGAVVAF